MTISNEQIERAIRAAYAGVPEQIPEALACMGDAEALLPFTVEQLRAALASLLAPVEAPADAPMRVAMEFPSYNERRWGLPWIAKVTAWPVAGRPTMEFGKFVGHAGDPGEAEMMAKRGDIVRWGHKDNRNGNSTWSKWGIVNAEGGIDEIDETEAREYLRK